MDEVVPAFFREAFNLLRQSIISVERDDVEMDEEEEAAMGNGRNRADEDGDSPMSGNNDDVDDDDDDNGGGGPSGQRQASRTPAPQQPRRTKITYDKYMKILNLLARRINEDETTTGEGVEAEDLKTWYLEQIEDELNSQDELESEKELVTKVLKRMVKDNIIMPIRGEGMMDADAGEGSAEDGGRIVYVLHPNCAVEEM